MSYSIDPQCMVFERIKACKSLRLKFVSISFFSQRTRLVTL